MARQSKSSADPSAANVAQGSAFSLRHVTLTYERGIKALDDVTLVARRGERVCVLGANGSGKSTLASVVCGLLAPDEGQVTLVGENVLSKEGVDFEAYRRARHHIGLVFQNPDDQIVTSIVEDDVAFGPENLGIPPEEIGTRVARELHRVALDDYAKADPSRLSGGQKQRVAIAGALAMEPDVLVLDEPGALLDVRGRRSIMGVMDKLHAAGTTIVHITHFMDEAFAADRVIVMDHGHIALEGTPDEVFAHGEELVELGLEEPFAARLSEGLRARGVEVPWTCEDDVLREAIMQAATPSRMAGSGDAAQVAASQAPHHDGSTAHEQTTTPAISCEGVSYSYTGTVGRKALDDVSFSVGQGQSVAIIGQTGSGKSTLLRLICALEVPDAGHVIVGGIDTATKKNRRLLHGHIGYVMQHPERQLFAETVAEDVAYGPRNLRLPSDEVDRRCRHALSLVGLSGKEGSSPFELSGGQKRLCAIAGVLAMEPTTLVLDEPTAGLDPRGRAELRRVLADIHAHGVTIVQVTHSMEDAVHAGGVVVLNQSRLLTTGTPSQVFTRANEQKLADSGLGLPRPLTWAYQLEAAGFPSLGQPLTAEALADAIAHIARGGE